MKEKLFVIGDLHGEYEMLKELLKKWDRNDQQLLFIGDLADRGPNSKSCIELVQYLVQNEGAICLTGNHEQIFLNFLRHPDSYFGNYLINGGGNTISSLLPDLKQSRATPEEIAALVKEHYPKLKNYIETLPLYYEWHDYIFVHAGVDLSLEDWKNTQASDFYWIREPFHHGSNKTGKTIVFGHTPTPILHQDSSNFNVWMSDNKIGIDGGAVYGGILHGLVFDEGGLVAHYGIQKTDETLQTISFK
ncbi:metallophosphoesterase family protein [Jeotgalibaca sp. A122]|uniref:metallophosphoesterase family protein n=1 Tax=Jeotgalibaca sp. A122 TaxID=3457322 RepID=UPI003FD39EE9